MNNAFLPCKVLHVFTDVSMLYRVVLTFESVDKILKCDFSLHEIVKRDHSHDEL